MQPEDPQSPSEHLASSNNPTPYDGIWPPPPAGSQPPAYTGDLPIGSLDEIAKLTKTTKLWFLVAFLFCAFLHVFTLYYGLKANRLGAKGAMPYVIGAIIHLAFVAAVIIWSVIKQIMHGP